MASRILRWGILSTARINRRFIPGIRASNRNQLVAVASRDQERSEAYARQWEIPRAFSSYEAMLASPDVDVVYISLPNSLHAEWSIKAARAGKHVLCEKPLAPTLREVEAMAAAAAEAGVVMAEAFMYRHHPQTLRVKELLDSGALGKLSVLRGSFTFTIADESNVRLNPALAGGSIWDVGCYPISYFRTMMGAEPVSVFGWGRIGASGVDETFAGQLSFPGEVYGQFDSGFRSPQRTHMEIVGTEGALQIPYPFIVPPGRQQLRLSRGDEVETIEVSGAEQLYQGEVEDMADAILEGKQPRIALADSRANVACILALLASARLGRPVEVEKII